MLCVAFFRAAGMIWMVGRCKLNNSHNKSPNFINKWAFAGPICLFIGLGRTSYGNRPPKSFGILPNRLRSETIHTKAPLSVAGHKVWNQWLRVYRYFLFDFAPHTKSTTTIFHPRFISGGQWNSNAAHELKSIRKFSVNLMWFWIDFHKFSIGFYCFICGIYLEFYNVRASASPNGSLAMKGERARHVKAFDAIISPYSANLRRMLDMY